MFAWLSVLLGSLGRLWSGQSGMATLSTSNESSNWSGTTPTIWDEGIQIVSSKRTVMDKFSGAENSGNLIIEKKELTRRAGQTITFTVVDPLLGEGVSGRTALQGSEEATAANTYTLSTVMYRQATATDDQAMLVSVFGRKWETISAKLLSEWFARRKDDDYFNEVLNTTTPETIYAGNATTRAGIAPGAYLLPHELRRLRNRAEQRGATPIRSVGGKGVPLPVFVAFMSEIDYYNLTNSSEFRQDVRWAWSGKGSENPAISDQIDMYQNVMLVRLAQVPASTGMRGSFLRPEARLRTTMTAAQTTLNIGPTTLKTGVDYGKYFGQPSGTQYLLVDSEIISYTPGASDPGVSSWATISRAALGSQAATHTAGAYVTANNLGKVLVAGQMSAFRGWSQNVERRKQTYDYEFEHGMAIQWMYDLQAPTWGDSIGANHAVMEVYSANPDSA